MKILPVFGSLLIVFLSTASGGLLDGVTKTVNVGKVTGEDGLAKSVTGGGLAKQVTGEDGLAKSVTSGGLTKVTGEDGLAKRVTGEDVIAKRVTGDDGLAKRVTGDEGLAKRVTGDDGLAKKVTGDEGIAKTVTGGSLAKGVTGDEGIAKTVTGGSLAKGVTGDDGLAKKVTGDEGLAKKVTGDEGLAKKVTGDEGIAKAVTGGSLTKGVVTGDDGITKVVTGEKGLVKKVGVVEGTTSAVTGEEVGVGKTVGGVTGGNSIAKGVDIPVVTEKKDVDKKEPVQVTRTTDKDGAATNKVEVPKDNDAGEDESNVTVTDDAEGVVESAPDVVDTKVTSLEKKVGTVGKATSGVGDSVSDIEVSKAVGGVREKTTAITGDATREVENTRAMNPEAVERKVTTVEKKVGTVGKAAAGVTGGEVNKVVGGVREKTTVLTGDGGATEIAREVHPEAVDRKVTTVGKTAAGVTGGEVNKVVGGVREKTAVITGDDGGAKEGERNPGVVHSKVATVEKKVANVEKKVDTVGKTAAGVTGGDSVTDVKVTKVVGGVREKTTVLTGDDHHERERHPDSVDRKVSAVEKKVSTVGETAAGVGDAVKDIKVSKAVGGIKEKTTVLTGAVEDNGAEEAAHDVVDTKVATIENKVDTVGKTAAEVTGADSVTDVKVNKAVGRITDKASILEGATKISGGKKNPDAVDTKVATIERKVSTVGKTAAGVTGGDSVTDVKVNKAVGSVKEKASLLTGDDGLPGFDVVEGITKEDI